MCSNGREINAINNVVLIYVGYRHQLVDFICWFLIVLRGFLGSGVCIFSRYPILETVYHDFPLNGHAHKILHGDWYGAKGCALAILQVKDLTVNLYATHVSNTTVHAISWAIRYNVHVGV